MRSRLIGEDSFRFWFQRVYLERFVRKAASGVVPGGTILDASAGGGMYRPLFSQVRYEAADFGQNESKPYGETTYLCDLSSSPVSDERFDMVLCTQVLEHVPEPKAVLAELYRVLKPDSRLWLSVPLYYAEHDAPLDYYRYTRYGFEHLLTSVGFELERIEPLEGYYGTLSYQFHVAMYGLPRRPEHYGGGVVGLVMMPVAAMLRVQFRALWFHFEQLDVRHKHVSTGHCINHGRCEETCPALRPVGKGARRFCEMRILVTGGAGYIGSHTAKSLAAAGIEPYVFDNLSTGHAAAVRWGPLIIGDLEDVSLLQEVLETYGISAVIHFAAKAYVGESIIDPEPYLHTNVSGTLTLLRAMRAAGVRDIVFSSTCATYGVPDRVPITEDAIQRPINPYGESKLFIERALRSYGAAYGLRSIILRYFNAAGADKDGEIGEMHDPETHILPNVIATALGQRDVLDVFGADYPTHDGTAVRDFVHVDDLAKAHVRALNHITSGGESNVFNLGTGRGWSIREIISSVESVSGRHVRVRIGGRRQGDPPILVADASKANQVLGWEPQHSNLECIVQSAWAWHVSQSNSGT